MDVLGLDIGGSGIKGALVNVTTGSLSSDRYRLPTPEEARPDDVAQTISKIVKHFSYKGVIGVGFPAVVHHGVAYSAANIDKSWIGTDVSKLLTQDTGCKSYVLNDADAAGLAEMEFGIGRKFKKGVAILLTVGTGIGSAVFIDGKLFPNTELGHLEIRGKDAERRASDATKSRKKWTWDEWAMRFQEVISTYERLFSPDVFIIGGGASKYFSEYEKFLRSRAEIVPAQLLNQAGLVGAAIYAHRSDSLLKSSKNQKKA
ncbi:MAG: ROK family protein [Leptolinea sp.]|nr:ROK family protein [Leptolinea sp.]